MDQMLPPEGPETVIRKLINEGATCALRFELEGREIARIEMLEGKVRSAEMSGCNARSAVRVIQRLPRKTFSRVEYLHPGQLGPKTLNTGEWELLPPG